MKRKFLKTAAVSLAAVMAFAACGGAAGTATPPAPGDGGAATAAATGDDAPDTDTAAVVPDGPVRRVVVGTGENPVLLTYLAERFNVDRVCTGTCNGGVIAYLDFCIFFCCTRLQQQICNI